MEDMNIINHSRRHNDGTQKMPVTTYGFSRRSSQLMKRTFDVLVASLLLLFLAPALLVLWWMASRDGGNAIFRQQRIGQNGKLFTCFKFRTMVPDAAQRLTLLLATSEQARRDWEDDFRLEQDPRVTENGQFLRSTSLDKLPQLWNVLRGDMSLVGPRPVMEVELDRYASQANYYLVAKPGITGLWQVSGRKGNDYATRAHFDALYVNNWNFWSDSRILCKSASELVRGKDIQ
ncbi:undecaprenyl-phosphate galactose phosphotransferase [Erwinia toletana]|uniref:Undecaprenyl-phosphate galactose phosphotransferase n=1 Tax=Winslowiella toletana TaxID=92490 RepID=A0ABS4P4C7_9GAMM|nr:sugar transferase [Winslowiella toletana]MBP2166930.1 undecaprenyl-phosphate galactose phosphotransferase [Winslowiella toletana]